MKKVHIILFVILFVTSCAEKRNGEQKKGLISNLVGITDNEDNGIKEILKYYGGECNYSVRFSASSSEGKKKYFELVLSQSEVIEKQSQVN
ncbi:MAG: hypothetical protein HYZ54_13400 [Ignavibacteriae bacterium]|nr:hypothetical protein [Ignavibacteriota bacterium]